MAVLRAVRYCPKGHDRQWTPEVKRQSAEGSEQGIRNQRAETRDPRSELRPDDSARTLPPI
eukprot:2058465-Rhodomonas_salina.1